MYFGRGSKCHQTASHMYYFTLNIVSILTSREANLTHEAIKIK